MRDLAQALAYVRMRIRQARDAHHSTAREHVLDQRQTRTTLLEPVLQALGWDVSDPEEVRLYETLSPTDHVADYALYLVSAPRVLIDVKALGEAVPESRPWAMLEEQLVEMGVRWFVSTDGEVYRLWVASPAATGDARIGRTVVVTEPDSFPEETLLYLSRAEILETHVEVLRRLNLIDSQVRATVDELFSPTAEFVRYLTDMLPDLSAEDVSDSLHRLRVHVDFSLTTRKKPMWIKAELVDQGRRMTPAELRIATWLRQKSIERGSDTGLPAQSAHRVRGQRRGGDRRSGRDRRTGEERRREVASVQIERRSGSERRLTERRSGLDRRAVTDRRRRAARDRGPP